MMSWQQLSSGPEETRALGVRLGQRLAAGMVVALSGELGAGKTCFAQGVARGLGVPESTPVTSPTFTLMNHYQGRVPCYHFDLYRLGEADELYALGLEEYLGGDGVALVEWAEPESLPAPALLIRFSWCGEQCRRLEFTASDARYLEILSSLLGSGSSAAS